VHKHFEIVLNRLSHLSTVARSWPQINSCYKVEIYRGKVRRTPLIVKRSMYLLPDSVMPRRIELVRRLKLSWFPRPLKERASSDEMARPVEAEI
jgi:hypothetical protein